MGTAVTNIIAIKSSAWQTLGGLGTSLPFHIVNGHTGQLSLFSYIHRSLDSCGQERVWLGTLRFSAVPAKLPDPPSSGPIPPAPSCLPSAN